MSFADNTGCFSQDIKSGRCCTGYTAYNSTRKESRTRTINCAFPSIFKGSRNGSNNSS